MDVINDGLLVDYEFTLWVFSYQWF